MNLLSDLVAAVQQDRERAIARDRLARFAERVRACCSPSALTRLVRALRPSTAVR